MIEWNSIKIALDVIWILRKRKFCVNENFYKSYKNCKDQLVVIQVSPSPPFLIEKHLFMSNLHVFLRRRKSKEFSLLQLLSWRKHGSKTWNHQILLQLLKHLLCVNTVRGVLTLNPKVAWLESKWQRAEEFFSSIFDCTTKAKYHNFLDRDKIPKLDIKIEN